MKNCEYFEDLISLYVDELIGEAELLELLEHIENCAECKSYYDDVKDQSNQLKGLNIELPEDLTEKILESFEKNREIAVVQVKAPKRKFTYMALGACACIALMVSLDFTLEKTVNIDEPIAVIAEQPVGLPMRMTEMPDENTQIITEYDQETPVSDIPDVETQFDDYAFVFFYIGDEICEIPNATIIYSDETTTHIEVENTIPKLQETMSVLEKNGFVENKAMTYKIDADSNKGLFIIDYMQ